MLSKYTDEHLKAAQALNLCTVSISQIIDYRDINIMEQEYEGILNNLNLEQMPKDEALLNVIRQILDTITFFRIEEVEKSFIEKDYQQKMKNAIWSAVPSISMFVGKDPVSMAISLASMVGTGYMNYRRAKAEASTERERAEWQLEKTAIEQFNGLRRELFDAAWRLSAAHNFPDELRLTERQIKQYNNILMDNDLIRKYERLHAIESYFIAYPPFWYNYGNTANEISRSDLQLSESTRAEFKERAKAHFTHFREVNQQGLLREDPISAACALELADLLDYNTDREKILELMDEAIKFSGRSNDVLQLVAMTYLKLNDYEGAVTVLSQLVNEQYNTTINAQILSSLYVKKYIESKSENVKAKYEVLYNQVGGEYLYPMPSNELQSADELDRSFFASQRENLYKKYTITVDNIKQKYIDRFDNIIPSTDFSRKNSSMTKDEKKYFARELFSKKNIQNYREVLKDRNIVFRIIEILNDLCDECTAIPIFNGNMNSKISTEIEIGISDKKDLVSSLLKKLDDDVFDYNDMEKLIDLNILDFTNKLFEILPSEIRIAIYNCNTMYDFTVAEQDLIAFCKEHNLKNPVIVNKPKYISLIQPKKHFDVSMILDEEKNSMDEQSAFNHITDLIKSRISDIIVDTLNIKMFIEQEDRARYFNNNKKLKCNDDIKTKAIAIIKNNSSMCDFIFTAYGIYPVKNDSIKSLVLYSDINLKKDKSNTIDLKGHYDCNGLNRDNLINLISKIKSIKIIK